MMVQPMSLGCFAEPGSDLLECTLGMLAAATGGPEIFGLLVGGTVLLSFYIASNGGLATPAVLLTLTGGLMIPTLPPQYRSMAISIVFLGLVAAVLSGLGKYVDNTP